MPEALRAAITAFGGVTPDKVVTNKDFEKYLDTSDEWITQRTGIKQRHVVSGDESTATLAGGAARAAMSSAGMSADQLDLIICATVSPEMPFPSTACFLQRDLGCEDIPAFDIGAACSGFIYALAVGRRFVETGSYKRVLVVGADALSRFVDWQDRSSCILFGDGAGAVVLEPSTAGNGVIYDVLCADGKGWDYLHIPAGGTRRPPSAETVANREHFVKMRGRDVYKFAVAKMQWLVRKCMDECGLTVDDIDLVVPHQVNIRIIDSAMTKCGFPLEKVYINIDQYGNTSAASIPLALSEAVAEGRASSGSTVLMAAFGAGLTWAGAVVKL